ncbi:inverse autotransporter beta domain-containing protein [Siccibacter turicensis]|uniref:inverse autotransporter beta domain-containing protein n=1 Tax=Siccibacter turicensis TaxID=357233 RepID=UPI0010212E31|nr:inverse autotransporter beta domain-containing protein [Siccibacter turicensis]
MSLRRNLFSIICLVPNIFILALATTPSVRADVIDQDMEQHIDKNITLIDSQSIPSARNDVVNQETGHNMDRDIALLDTKPYTLKPGETVAQVAKQYGLTIAQLKKLNQFRVFAHGFYHLKAGDELEVPVTTGPLDGKKIFWDGKTADSQAPGSQASQLAAYASQVGPFLASHPNSHAVKGMLKDNVVNKANEKAQKWISHFGTGQIQLGVDDDYSLKNSSLSLLHPWYDTPENMVFSQTSLHRSNDRTQMNVGAGYRHFRKNDMLGANIFMDYDLSRNHARAGFGGEYKRDFMNLSANAYIHLSGWKESSDITDYDERPANGWDVRATGYLPNYPQLGAKVSYEQYYGNEVALSGSDHRHANPHALTVGVNYTPFPLLTLNVNQKIEGDGKHDTEFLADLNYHIGEPLSHQLDTSAVTDARSLMGSHYDLVDRNNDIVLEYRKQQVIKLHVPERIKGFGGQVVPLNINVKAKYGLRDIEWDDRGLLAAGGKLTGEGTQWYLTLPAWNPNVVNAWSIIAIAHDTKNNASKPAEIEVVLTPPVVTSVAISGKPIVGNMLKAIPSGPDASSTISYQWQIETAPGSNEFKDISGATAPTYQVLDADQKKEIRVVINA